MSLTSPINIHIHTHTHTRHLKEGEFCQLEGRILLQVEEKLDLQVKIQVLTTGYDIEDDRLR